MPGDHSDSCEAALLPSPDPSTEKSGAVHVFKLGGINTKAKGPGLTQSPVRTYVGLKRDAAFML